MKTIVPDTGVLIDGRITELLAEEKEGIRLVVSHSVIAELEYQANTGRETGFAGLEELRKLSQLGREGRIVLEFAGERPNSSEIARARFGEIDAKIRGLAKSLNAVLLTTDRVQSKVAEAEGICVEFLYPIVADAKLNLEKFFDANTLSVHLKEGCVPKAKVGLPGAFEFKAIGKLELKRREIADYAKEAVEYSKRHEKGFIEIDKKGATVIQVKDYRITFTKPPFSEAAELTAVRPIRKMALLDYSLSARLAERLDGRAEGVLIAGPPGSGKSTFATALAEHYSGKGKVVKTLEQPRDLQVSKEITQYGALEGDFLATSDILLLVRPDYTVYDEVRKPNDFIVFSDLRMAGIGMVGVVHASKPIDAVQRFIGKIDLGVIPQVVDTIVFIDKGSVGKVYSLSFTVKVPHGMTEKDLARPVIEVKDLDSGVVEFELYKFGDETVVLPVGLASAARQRKPVRMHPLDEVRVKKILAQEAGAFNYEISGDKVVLHVPEHSMAKVIGKKGKSISRLEKRLGMRVDVRSQACL